MGRTPRLFVVSGPAGVGKGTLVARVKAMRPNLSLPVSATTRLPRPGEIDGVAYHFLTDEEFTHSVEHGDFLEWAQVHDHRYGTLKSEVDSSLARGESVILEIDVQGGENVRKMYPDVVRVFVEPPSWDVLVARLKGRGTESEESLAIRLRTAKRELSMAYTYDVRIVNDDLDEAVKELAYTLERYELSEE
ncbi:MAG: guanylate kinase [Coriobacteriales bacterium]|nr:guanylate kinase [Coriobacteriales bacterium]